MALSKIFKREFQVARVSGIPVRIDFRWLFVFVLSVWLIAGSLQRTEALQSASGPMLVFLAAVTSIGFFLSVFGHELSHAIAARLEGIETEEIILHPFGGLARLRNQPPNPRAEFRIAVAGPAASFVLAVLSFAAMLVAGMGGYLAAASVFFFIFFGNLLLAVFNLFPGYPLDGGRVLRAALWHRGRDIAEATRIAGRFGQMIALALIAFGAYVALLRRDWFTGFWCALVGLFLLDAANSIVRESPGAREGTVAEAMSAPHAIEPDTLINYLINAILPARRQTVFPVAHEGRLHGLLLLEDLKELPRERWARTRAHEVMRPVSPQLFIASSASLNQALKLMEQNGVGALAVVGSGGELVGFLQRGRVKRRA